MLPTPDRGHEITGRISEHEARQLVGNLRVVARRTRADAADDGVGQRAQPLSTRERRRRHDRGGRRRRPRRRTHRRRRRRRLSAPAQRQTREAIQGRRRRRRCRPQPRRQPRRRRRFLQDRGPGLPSVRRRRLRALRACAARRRRDPSRRRCGRGPLKRARSTHRRRRREARQGIHGDGESCCMPARRCVAEPCSLLQRRLDAQVSRSRCTSCADWSRRLSPGSRAYGAAAGFPFCEHDEGDGVRAPPRALVARGSHLRSRRRRRRCDDRAVRSPRGSTTNAMAKTTSDGAASQSSTGPSRRTTWPLHPMAQRALRDAIVVAKAPPPSAAFSSAP